MLTRQLLSKALWLSLLCTLWVPRLSQAAPDGVPVVTDLHAVAVQAAKARKPVLVMFEADGCPYCQRVMRDYLNPMSKNREYDNKVTMVRVDISSQSTLVDFQGHKTTPGSFSQRYHARLTPTIILFNANGQPLENPIVGFNSPDYYGYYLDKAIDASLGKIRGNNTLSLR